MSKSSESATDFSSTPRRCNAPAVASVFRESPWNVPSEWAHPMKDGIKRILLGHLWILLRVSVPP